MIHKDATVMTEPEKKKIKIRKKSSGAMEHIDIYQTVILINSR